MLMADFSPLILRELWAAHASPAVERGIARFRAQYIEAAHSFP